jgi:hypothetical protein
MMRLLSIVVKIFDVLAISLKGQHNYFDGLTK